MAPVHYHMGSWLALFASLAVVQAQTRTSSRTTTSRTSSSTSPFWTYTSRFQYSVSTSLYTYRDGSVDTDLYTATRTIKSGVTPSVAPARTTTEPFYGYDSLQIIEAYYSPGAVAESDLSPTYSFGATTRTTTSSMYVSTEFRMPVTYTAPASCPTQFTISLNETVSVPTEVRDQVTPVTIITGSTRTYLTYGPSVTETWYLTTGAAPLRSQTAVNYDLYVASCSTPYSYDVGDGNYNYHSGGSSSTDDLTVCSWYSGCTSLKTWIIIIASIIPGLFVLGFIESWFWFRRLMLGKGALRFGTISWICISLWVACFTRTQSARSKDDQKLLREKWNNTPSTTAFKLWWKWGFRHAYPVPLLGQYSRNTVGIVPEGQPLPQMGQAPGPVYGPGFQPPPAGIPQNGQPYYPPPPGWAPPPNGQGYPVPPPGQTYMPPPNGAGGYYTEQAKENASVTERTVSPPLPMTQPSPHPPPGTAPPPSVSPQPSPLSEPAQLADTQQSPPPGGPHAPRPT